MNQVGPDDCRDATLEGIAASRPTTLAQLRSISGIGDKKLERYGGELIALADLIVDLFDSVDGRFLGIDVDVLRVTQIAVDQPSDEAGDRR